MGGSSPGVAHDDAADRLTRTHQQLTEAIETLAAGGQWQQMLAAAAKFPRYSPSNVLLIMRQKPDATRIAGLRTWNSLGRRVNKGEKSIAILAPCVYPKREKSQACQEPDSSGPPSDGDVPAPDDGSSTRAKHIRGFRVVSVFDISQTSGEPVPDLPRPVQLPGAAPAGAWEALARVAAVEGYRLERGPCDGADGFTDYNSRVVRVRDDVDDAHALVVLSHELGHIRAEHETRFPGRLYATSRQCRGLAEVEAQSIAHLVAVSLGVPAAAMSVPYVAGWANGDANLLRATATRVITTARDLLAAADLLPAEDDRAVVEPVRVPHGTNKAATIRWQPAAPTRRIPTPATGAAIRL